MRADAEDLEESSLRFGDENSHKHQKKDDHDYA